MKAKRGVGLIAAVVVCVIQALTTRAALATTLLDTTGNWQGQAVGTWGEPVSATVGQTFTVGEDNELGRFTFFVNDEADPDFVAFAAYVMRWTGSRPVAPILFESGPLSTTNNGGTDGWEVFEITTGDLPLLSGEQYVAFFSASKFFDGQTGLAWVGYAGETYGDGTFVYIDNGADFGGLTGRDWITDYPGGDLAFRMVLLPEPVTLSLLALGGLAVVRRRGG